jgi:hypothetical protein
MQQHAEQMLALPVVLDAMQSQQAAGFQVGQVPFAHISL